MLKNLPFSLFTLILLLSKSVWALALAFTNADYNGIATGTPFEIEWSGDGTPVTIVLLTGPAENLETVATIVDSATTSPYTWTPPQTLPAGVYALSIAQSGSTNYSPRFPLTSAYGASGVDVGAGTSAAPPSTTGTGTPSEALYPTHNPIVSHSNVTNSVSPTTTTPPSYPYPYPYPYGSAGTGNGNGSTLGVATGVVGGEKGVLAYTGGAERGTWASVGVLAVGAGVGIVFGGWGW